MFRVFILVLFITDIAVSDLPMCSDLYITGLQISKGGSATIIEATIRQDRTNVVIKVFQKERKFDQEFNVINHMSKAHKASKGLVEWRCFPKIYGACIYVKSKAIVMERFDRHFEDVVNSHPTFSQNVIYTKGILECVAELHELGFVHRDIKTDNVMLTYDGNVKIIDFDLAIPIEQEHSSNAIAGTAFSAAPEGVISGNEDGMLIRNVKGDAWSTGFIVFALFSRDHVIHDDSLDYILDCVEPHTLYNLKLQFIISYFIYKCIFDTGAKLNMAEVKTLNLHKEELSSCCLFRFPLHVSRENYSHCDGGNHWLVNEYQTNLKWMDNLWKASSVPDIKRAALYRLITGLLVFDHHNRDTVNVALKNALFTME